MAAMAMIRAETHPQTVRAALTWLVEQKDSLGTWHSTQATVLALKAILAGTRHPLGDGRERQITIALGNEPPQTVTIPPNQHDVLRQLDLSSRIPSGKSRLTLSERSQTASGYQVAVAWHVPGQPGSDDAGIKPPLSIRLRYDRTELKVNDTVTVEATIENHLPSSLPMVIVDLPIPPGFAIQADDFATMAAKKQIARFEITPRRAVVYLRRLAGRQPMVINYHLTATTPVKVTSAPASVYEYYDPDNRAASGMANLAVIAQQ